MASLTRLDITRLLDKLAKADVCGKHGAGSQEICIACEGVRCGRCIERSCQCENDE